MSHPSQAACRVANLAKGWKALVFVGIVVAVWVFRSLSYSAGRPIDSAVIEQLEIGMSEVDAVRLIGMPPGDYRTDGFLYVCSTRPPLSGVKKEWLLDNVQINIWFHDGRIKFYDTCPAIPPESWLDCFKRLLGV